MARLLAANFLVHEPSILLWAEAHAVTSAVWVIEDDVLWGAKPGFLGSFSPSSLRAFLARTRVSSADLITLWCGKFGDCGQVRMRDDQVRRHHVAKIRFGSDPNKPIMPLYHEDSRLSVGAFSTRTGGFPGDRSLGEVHHWLVAW